ncbi:hypothetical protein BS333_18885 [Vibrio azureus]|nr:hypothetical protein BS333_18885 [Vibrio azureus]
MRNYPSVSKILFLMSVDVGLDEEAIDRILRRTRESSEEVETIKKEIKQLLVDPEIDLVNILDNELYCVTDAESREEAKEFIIDSVWGRFTSEPYTEQKMNLKYPETSMDFNPTPAFCLGGFNVYDRDDSLGEFLNQFDPNDPEQLAAALDDRLFSGCIEIEFSPAHKKEIMEVLKEALMDSDYNFESLLEDDPDDYYYLPIEWEIKNPRKFFEFVYLKMYEKWAELIMADGFTVTKPEEINIIASN